LLIEGFAQPVLREIEEGDVAVEDARVAHEDVELTKRPDGLLHGPLIVRDACDIALHRRHGLAEVGFQLFHPCRNALQNPDARPFGDKPRHDRPSDA
jgi:hypothetical protein